MSSVMPSIREAYVYEAKCRQCCLQRLGYCVAAPKPFFQGNRSQVILRSLPTSEILDIKSRNNLRRITLRVIPIKGTISVTLRLLLL